MAELKDLFFERNAWSYTRYHMWDRCRRQYYYNYIAQYLKPPTTLDIKKIMDLKEFDSKNVLQGSIIHEILDEQIKCHCNKMPMDPAYAFTKYSQRIAVFKQMGDVLLVEYINGEKFDPNFFSIIDESGKECLEIFFNQIWPEYKNRECLHLEEDTNFKIDEIKILAKVDLVTRTKDGLIVITDWKTGKESEEPEARMQMAAYTLWAMNHYDKSPDEIVSELVFLKTGNKKTFVFFEEELDSVKEKIKKDFESMNASYEIEDFSANPHQRECMSCKFAKICPEAKIF